MVSPLAATASMLVTTSVGVVLSVVTPADVPVLGACRLVLSVSPALSADPSCAVIFLLVAELVVIEYVDDAMPVGLAPAVAELTFSVTAAPTLISLTACTVMSTSCVAVSAARTGPPMHATTAAASPARSLLGDSACFMFFSLP